MLDLAGLKNEECRKKFCYRVSINIGLQTRKRMDDGDSFTKCIQDAAKETLQALAPRKKSALASADTIYTYDSVGVARATGDVSQ
ncbi:hypothetical protein RB195_007496 [Necator americanus]|uniref:Uncharacterized protein n=1 Tax=Necator americanus TaxID=51031 RepID=A0ABR1C093_NECAM